MLLFARTVTLGGGPRKAMAAATEIAAYVNKHSGLEVALWAAMFGAPVGTVAYTARVESHAALAAATAGLMTDNGYLDLIDKRADMALAPPQDTLREVIHGQPTGVPAIGSVATVITAVAGAGKVGDAVAWGIDIADHVASVTKVPVIFARDMYGTFGGLAWISAVADSAAVDKANAALATDTEYMKRLAGGAGLFVEGSANGALLQRVA